MRGMLSLDPQKIRALQGNGGIPFTKFMNDLIRTHAAAAGIPDSAIETNIRINISDQGADAVLLLPDPRDSTGRLCAPSVWQYKACARTNVGSARELLKGNYVRERIRNGFAFRLAVSDNYTSPQRHALTEKLNRECRRITPGSADAMVVSADDLAAWANRFLGLVLSFSHTGLEKYLIHLDAWGLSAAGATPRFVRVLGWERAMAELTTHVDFTRASASVIRTVQGEAGVGKSRLVYEVLALIPAMRGFTAYCNDEESCAHVARYLANAQQPPGIFTVLVADECGPMSRERLRKILQGHGQHLRVIAIDNSGKHVEAEDPELWIEKMPGESLEQVLGANYGHIPEEHRRAYAELAKGYPRLAADLCSQHAAIMAAGGDISRAVPTITQFLRVRLSEVQFQALGALSLVMRIGYQEDVVAEFGALCTLVGLPVAATQEALGQIHDGPGFVARAGRYLYLTPAIVAVVAFKSAWNRWAEADPAGFLSRVPDPLLPTFLDRVNRSADEVVRRCCGEYLHDWATRLRAEDLISGDTTRRLVALVDTNPEQYLPFLLELFKEAPPETLRRITGESRSGKWGPRRALVWLTERMACFPEYFDLSERVLVRLAAAESEPEIGNNATAIWKQLFRIRLSGTATPFADRVSRLRERLWSDTPEIRALALGALDELFDSHSIRMLGDSIVAGRIPPEEWRPRSRAEQAECFRMALATIRDAICAGRQELIGGLVKTLAGHARSLIFQGFLREVREIIDHVALTDIQRIMLLEAIDEFLIFDAPRVPGSVVDLAQAVRVWRESLVGSDLHSRLLSVAGKQPWSASRLQDETWKPALQKLALELLQVPHGLSAELPWLFSDQAPLGRELGDEMGQHDGQGRLLDEVLNRALHAEHRGFALGYVRGLLTGGDEHAKRLNAWLDAHELDAPVTVADISLAAGERLRPFDRILRLFDRQALPISALYSLGFTVRNESDDRFEQIIGRLVCAAEKGSVEARQAGLDLLAYGVHGENAALPVLARDGIREAAWRLIELTAADEDGRTHWWGMIVERLGERDPARAAVLACRALVGDSFLRQDQAKSVLITLAKLHPSEIMNALGEVALDERLGWRFFVDSFNEVIAAISSEIVEGWLRQVGVEGARRLARHLPKPYLDANKPVVPPLTAWVLSEFAEDDRVFQEFCAGVHSFEMYSGDIAAAHEAEAALARAFQSHELKRIREWARQEERSGLEEARRARQRTAELDLL